MFIMQWWESFKNIPLIDCVDTNSSPTTYNFQIRNGSSPFQKSRTDSKSKTTKNDVILV